MEILTNNPPAPLAVGCDAVLIGLVEHFQARLKMASEAAKRAADEGEERHEIEWRERCDCWRIVIQKLEQQSPPNGSS